MSNLSLAHDTQNDTRTEEFKAFVRERGREAALGKDALPSLAIGFIRAVYDGAWDMDKDANGEDGAVRMFKMYAASEGKKAIHNRTEQSVKVQSSKFRQLGNFAGNPKWDAVDITNRAFTIHQKALDEDVEMKSAFPAYVDLAREQLKRDDAMSDDEILAVMSKSESTKEVTLEGQLKKMHKIAEGIITGEKNPGVIDQTSEMHQIEEMLRVKIAEVVALREKDEKLTKMIEMGFVQGADGTWSMQD
jgi:hypothetical protein